MHLYPLSEEDVFVYMSRYDLILNSRLKKMFVTCKNVIFFLIKRIDKFAMIDF